MNKIFLFLLIPQISLAMTAVDFVDLLKKNHPFFNEQKLINTSKNINKKLANPYQDWNFISGFNYTDTNADNLINTVNNQVQTSYVGVNKTDINTGAHTNISYNLIKFNTKNNIYDNKLSIEYKLPLKKNKNGINDRLALDIADFEIQINNIQSTINRNNFINSWLKKFINLAFLQQKVQIFTEVKKLAKQQLNSIKDKFKANITDISNVLLQKDDYNSSTINLLNAKSELSTSKYELQNIIKTNDIFSEFDLNNITDFSKNINLTKLAKIRIFELKVKKINREKISLNNQQQANLDLKLNASLNGKNTTLGKSFSTSPSLGIGIELALPIGNSVNTNKILKKNNQLRILASQKQQLMINLTYSINSLQQKLTNIKKIIKLEQQRTSINQQNYIEQQKLYKNGNTELNFVLSAQNKSNNSKLNNLIQLNNYQQLISDYKNLIL